MAALGLTLAFYLVAWGYKTVSPRILPPLAQQLGGIALAQGARAEAALNLDKALALYQQALRGQLGADDRTHVNKRCGVILWKRGDFAAALPYLQTAQSAPKPSRTGYRPLAECLVGLGHWADGEAVTQRWLAALPEDAPDRADAYYLLGCIAMNREDRAAARDQFDAAVAVSPYHRALVELARMDDEANRRDTAIVRLTTFLAGAPPGPDSRQAALILESWLR
jgi:tetratricopeptide (TPR) repeat protein